MRIIRFNTQRPRIGAVKDDGVVDLVHAGCCWTTNHDIAAAGDVTLCELKELVERATPTHRLADVQLVAPIERPGKYLAIGMNYAKHVEEADRQGVARSNYQTWFNKQTTRISGPCDDIESGVTEKPDYEVELGAVISRPAKRVSEAEAKNPVLGYCVANDVSARSKTVWRPKSVMWLALSEGTVRSDFCHLNFQALPSETNTGALRQGDRQ
jgi:2-keto-4-pentenoate hydratase/2-oxohepta-3-ene-1,7-dioic acid hydratase in catechol pathway